MPLSLDQLRFDNTYAALGDAFFSWQQPSPFPDLRLANANPLALDLLDLARSEAQRPEFTRYMTGLSDWQGSQPLAMLYAGHQFGHWVPQLGDGRAILLGQIRNQADELWELQLKGGGPTPYSRSGDGRAVLRSTIREYLCSEAMFGLGIPTTRSLALFHSDAPVYREEVETAAMMIRLAPSHVRFGSFEVFYHRGQHESVKRLADYVIDTYYPACRDSGQPVAELFSIIVDKTASMIAQWQAVGFAHGVMNTDNMSVLGLTLDYGPFGFMETYNPGFICNHSDHEGRYAFDQQPRVAMWNLVCLGSALLDIIGEDTARDIVQRFADLYTQYYEAIMLKKLGLQVWQEGDDDIIKSLLRLMRENASDYTITLRALSQLDFANQASQDAFIDLFIQRETAQVFLQRYHKRLLSEGVDTIERQKQMLSVNPKYILRNYMAEVAIRKAKQGDFSEVERLLVLLHSPFDEHADCEEYAGLPPDWANQLSVSCSS